MRPGRLDVDRAVLSKRCKQDSSSKPEGGGGDQKHNNSTITTAHSSHGLNNTVKRFNFKAGSYLLSIMTRSGFRPPNVSFW